MRIAHRRLAAIAVSAFFLVGLTAAPANAHHLPYYYGSYGSALGCDMTGRSAVQAEPHWVEWWCNYNSSNDEWDLWVR